MSAPTVPTPEPLRDPSAQTSIEGALAEQDHQYRDLDPDSTCCPDGFACPACPPNDGGAA